MSESIDPSNYVHQPQLDVAGSLSFGKALLAAAPHGAGAAVVKAGKALHSSVVALAAAFNANAPQTSVEDLRAFDQTLDHAWAAFDDRLSAYASLPTSSKSRANAVALRAEIFPDGMTFLKLNYPSEHAESEKRLAIVKSHEKDFDVLVGEEFIASLRAAHAAYGKALGITEAKKEITESVSLAEPLAAFRAAAGKYALQVLAFGDDEKHSAAARKALAPVDAFRAITLAARGGKRKAAAPAPLPPDAPAPAVPIPAPPA